MPSLWHTANIESLPCATMQAHGKVSMFAMCQDGHTANPLPRYGLGGLVGGFAVCYGHSTRQRLVFAVCYGSSTQQIPFSGFFCFLLLQPHVS